VLVYRYGATWVLEAKQTVCDAVSPFMAMVLTVNEEGVVGGVVTVLTPVATKPADGVANTTEPVEDSAIT
jgi:hypothetical protein